MMKAVIALVLVAGGVAGGVLLATRSDTRVENAAPATPSKLALISRAGIAPPLSFATQETGFRVAYAPTSDADRDKVRDLFVRDQIFDRIAHSLNELLAMPRTVDIQLVDCGAPNAFYDPTNHRIIVCYELITYFLDTFRPHAKSNEELGAAVLGATVFAFFHELGHALIGELDLPSTGREEDGADQIATLILLEAGDDGVQMALSGAQWFGLLAAENATRTPFWDEHALDGQRFFNVVCLVYGEKPDARTDLIGKALPEPRAKRCPAEYRAIANAWDKLIKSHLRAPSSAPAHPTAVADDGPSCAAVGAHAIEVVRHEAAASLAQELERTAPDERDAARASFEDRLKNLAAAIEARCAEQTWSVQVRACLLAAPTTERAGECLE